MRNVDQRVFESEMPSPASQRIESLVAVALVRQGDGIRRAARRYLQVLNAGPR